MSRCCVVLCALLLIQAAHSDGNAFQRIVESNDSNGSVIVILPINMLGLANRLRIMASLYTILVRLRADAESSGRPFVMLTVWEGSRDCPAEFDELFLPHSDENVVVQSLNQFVSSSDPNESFESNIRNHVNRVLAELPEIRGGVYTKEVFPKRGLLEDDFFYPMGTGASGISSARPIVVTVWTRGTHSLRSMGCQDLMYSKSLFYQGLEPVPPLSAIIRNFKYSQSLMRGRRVIGIHVRAFDAVYDWAVVSPSAGPAPDKQSNKSIRFDEASPIEAFIDIMRQILDYEPSTMFFVASNSISAKIMIHNQFPGNVVSVYPAESSGIPNRDSLSGMSFALVEFFILGEASIIIHSRGSSFAREAAFRLMRPTIDVSALFHRANDLTHHLL